MNPDIQGTTEKVTNQKHLKIRTSKCHANHSLSNKWTWLDPVAINSQLH